MENEKVEDRICNYSGLLSVEQYMLIDKEEDTWTEEDYLEIAHS